MDEAAPQAAAGADTEEVAKALEVLRLRGELDYLTGYDKEHGWWASRRGVIGHILTADSPEDLGQMIGLDPLVRLPHQLLRYRKRLVLLTCLAHPSPPRTPSGCSREQT
jgi:hypothetical protein